MHFFGKKIIFFRAQPKFWLPSWRDNKKQRFVLTPLHGGRRGGRRGPFLAQKSPFSSYTHITPITHTTLKRMFFFNWPFRDIKISKPPYVPFSKMFELCHFLSLLDLPERNYMWLSFLITLYRGWCTGDDSPATMHRMHRGWGNTFFSLTKCKVKVRS